MQSWLGWWHWWSEHIYLGAYLANLSKNVGDTLRVATSTGVSAGSMCAASPGGSNHQNPNKSRKTSRSSSRSVKKTPANSAKAEPMPTNQIAVNTSKPTIKIQNVPERVIDVMNKVMKNGKLDGYVSKLYKNISEPFLPKNVQYFEHDIFPQARGINRGAERLVFGNDGSVYYTPDHYVSWIKIIK